MASSAFTSASSSTQQMREELLPAGPLPRKRGEIGYMEVDQQGPTGHTNRDDNCESVTQEVDLSDALQPHPAERREYVASTQPRVASPALSRGSRPSKKSFFLLKQSKPVPFLQGMRGTSLVRFIILFCTIGGIITGWALTIQKLNRMSQRSSESGSTPQREDTLSQMASTTFIFVHVAFAVVVLFLLLFLERALFQLRAERYAFKHPGDMLPRHGQPPPGPMSIGFAPWTRPPLPTYAQSLGVRGTGDVEDQIIAQPPPPAYGNTRGSTLLLSGMIRNSLRLQLDRIREMNDESRPVSYISRDEEAETRSDAMRARQLEEALSRLEEGARTAGADSVRTNTR